MDSKTIFNKERLDKILADAFQKRGVAQQSTESSSNEVTSDAAKSEALQSPLVKMAQRALNFSNYPTYKLNSPIKKYLPISLKYNSKTKTFEKLGLLIGLSFLLSFAGSPAKAAPMRPRNSLSNLQRLQSQLRQTEAGSGVQHCTDCAPARSPSSSLSQYLAGIPAGPERLHNVAIFERDRRQAVADLLRRNPRTLTVEEKAILQASARTGQIVCGNNWVNATLIQLADGTDAVMASAHTLVDTATGQPRCDLTKIEYLPNVTFYLGEVNEFNMRGIKTDGQLPMNLETVNRPGAIPASNDFLVFALSEKPSQDKLPNGTTRGFMKLASNVNQTGTRYLIGYNNDFRMAETPSYEPCDSGMVGTRFHHFCASKGTTSGAVLTELVDGEMVLSAINKGEWDEFKNQDIVPRQDSLGKGNVGVSVEYIKSYLSELSKPAVVYNGVST